MPRFQVTAELNTSQAEKQLAALVTKIKEAGRALNDASKATGGSGGTTALDAQGKAAAKVNQELLELQARIKGAQSDMAKIGVEIKTPAGITAIRKELEDARKAAVALETEARAAGDLNGWKQYAAVVKEATNSLDRLAAAQRGAAGRGGAKSLTFGAEGATEAQRYGAAIRELDQHMSQMESHRKAGQGTLGAYRQELQQIERAARAQANNPNLSATDRGLYASRADKARTLINRADTAEAEKLALAVMKLKAALASEEITAERAGIALSRLAERARTLSEAQGIGAAAAQRYIRAQQAAQQAAKSASGGDAGLAAARAAQAEIQNLAARRTAGLIDPNAAVAARKYRAELQAIVTASVAEARNTRLSTEARNAHAKAAEQAANALKRLRAEQTNLAGGGSAAFALNTVAFGFGGLGAGAGQFLSSALDLNEQANMAAININAVADFYDLGREKLKDTLKRTATDIRVGEVEVSKAMTLLAKAGFNPEMIEMSIKRFSDSGVANAIDANKAIVAAAQGIQMGLSRTLNTAGIEENIGPYIQDISAAVRKGEEYYRTVFLTNEEARKQYDALRESGRGFREAADAAGRFQFGLKATAVDAGRTAEVTDSLTAALGNFRKVSGEAKIGLLEGVSRVAAPAINIASDALAWFNGLPNYVKSTVGLTAAMGTLGLVTVAATAGTAALAIQTYKVIGGETILAGVQGRLIGQTGLLTAANVALNRSYTLTSFLSAAAVGSMNLFSKAATGAVATLGRFLFNPYTLIIGGTVAAAAAIQGFGAKTLQIYDDIEKADKEFQDNLVATRGEEFAGKLNQLMTMMEVKGNFQKQLAEADTPEERAAAQERIKRADERIQTLRTEMRELNRLRAEKNGDAAATREQAEAYNNLKFTLDGVAERFGDMKLTGFQKDLRSLQTEYTRFLAQVEKASIPDADGIRQITPEQEEKLRAQAERLVPEGMAGLVERELDSARKSARTARLEMEREQADLMKDGVAKRKALLSVETRQTREEYAERLKTVRANMRDPNLQPNASLGPAENKRRMGLLRELANAEQLLFQERDGKIKSLEQKATADLAQIRQERADRMLDLLKGQARAEVNAVTTSLTTLNLARDRALAGQDEAGRLRVEQNFQRQALGLAKERIEREAGIREGELQTQLARELRDAEALGDGKGRAEALARQRYDQESRANRQNAVNELAQAELDAQERVSAARVALVERTVDRELAGIGEIEGAQLAALQRRYARERQLAQARGDEKGAEAYQSALDKVAQEAESRARDAQKLADDARNSVENLTERLEELNGVAAKGLRGAQIAAEKPFTAYIREREKEIEALNRAKANLVNGSPALRADIDRQIAVLNTYVQQATAGRTRASAEAGRAFQQAQFDKIMRERARVAEALYDGGEGDSRAYRAAIAEEATYWRARMRGMEKGSDEYEAARARLEELRQKDAEARSRDALRPLELARQNLTLNEGQQRLARTEAERNRLMDDRIRLLRRVIELESKRANDPNLKRSDREQAAQNVLAARSQLQESMTARGTAAASDLRATLATLDAQRQLAVGDAARAAIDARRLRTAQAIAAQDAANAARQNLTLEERRAAEAQALTSQKAVLDIQRAIQDEQNATVRSVRDLAAAQLDYAATVAVTDEQTTNALRDRAALLRTQLADQDALIEQAIRRGDTEASVNALRAERVRLQGQEITTARELARRPLELAERQLGTYKEIQTAKAQIAGLDGDSVASARLALDFAERELDVARQKYALAQTQAEREAAGAGVLTAYAGVTKAQTGVARAGLEAERTQLDLLTAQENARFSMLSTEQRQAQEGERAAQQAARQLAFVERQLDLAEKLRLSDRERNDLQVKRLDLIAQEADRIRAMNDDARARAKEGADRFAPKVEEARKALMGESAADIQRLEAAVAYNEATVKRIAEINKGLRDAGENGAAEQNARAISEITAVMLEQQNLLNAARRTAAVLNHDLVLSEAELNAQIRSGAEGTRSLTTASLALHRSREALIAAEREYEAANRGENKERLKTATEGLIKAIGDERTAVQGVQGEYRKLLDTMSSVQDAGAKLRSALGDGERKESLNANREIDRLMSIERRRDAAAGILRTALASGDSARIAEAANELAAQQERYRNQVALLKKAGVSVSASGEGVVRALADEVDRLGVTYDAQAVGILRQQEQVRREEELQARQTADWKARHDGEAGLLSRRAAIADQEMEAARLWVQTSEGLTTNLEAIVEGARAAGTALIQGLPRRSTDRYPEALAPRAAAAEPPKKTDVQLALEKAEQNQAQFKALADRLAAIPSVLDVKAEQMKKVGQNQPSPVQPTASNATRITNVTVQNTFHTTLNGPTGTSPQEVRMAIEQALDGRIDQAAQRKAWEGGC